MFIDLTAFSSEENYQTLIQLVVPRPIAWILSQNEDQKSYNLAPFSFFNIAALDPCIFSVSFGLKDDQQKKDSLRNIESGRTFVVHICSEEDASLVSASAMNFAYGESEVDKLQLKVVDSEGKDNFPRLDRAKAAFRCKHLKSLEIGNDGQTLALLEVKSLWVNENILDSNQNYPLEVNFEKLSPLGRLGANQYLKQGKAFSSSRLSL